MVLSFSKKILLTNLIFVNREQKRFIPFGCFFLFLAGNWKQVRTLFPVAKPDLIVLICAVLQFWKWLLTSHINLIAGKKNLLPGQKERKRNKQLLPSGSQHLCRVRRLLTTIRHKGQKTWRCCGCYFVVEGISNLCLQPCQSCSAAQLLQPLWDQGSGFGLSMWTLHVLLMLVWVFSGYPVTSHSRKPWVLCWLETENCPWVGASTLI